MYQFIEKQCQDRLRHNGLFGMPLKMCQMDIFICHNCGKRDTNATRGRGKGLAKVSCDIFSKFLKPYFCIFACFFKGERSVFGKQKCHITPGESPQCRQMKHGEGGSKV